MKEPIDGMIPRGDPDTPMTEGDSVFPVCLGIFGSAFSLMKVGE